MELLGQSFTGWKVGKDSKSHPRLVQEKADFLSLEQGRES